MPLLSTPTIALSIFKTQNMETFVETLPPSQLLPLPGPDSQPNRSGWRSRPIAKSLQGIKSTLDGQFQNLVMTMLENPHLEVANCICICTPPQWPGSRSASLQSPKNRTARCRQQGGLEEWPNTAGTAPTNSLTPHDQRPNSDQKHGQCQTDFITRPPHSRTDLLTSSPTFGTLCLALFCPSTQAVHSSPASPPRGRPRRPAGATRDQRAGKQSSNGAACNTAGKNILPVYFCTILCRWSSPCGQVCPGFLNVGSK